MFANVLVRLAGYGQLLLEIAMDELSALIRARRGVLQLSQAKAAEAIGVGVSTYQNWEAGNSFPKVLVVPRLASWLDVEPIAIERLRSQSRTNPAEG